MKVWTVRKLLETVIPNSWKKIISKKIKKKMSVSFFYKIYKVDNQKLHYTKIWKAEWWVHVFATCLKCRLLKERIFIQVLFVKKQAYPTTEVLQSLIITEFGSFYHHFCNATLGTNLKTGLENSKRDLGQTLFCFGFGDSVLFFHF